jgi:hypothetical protein
MGKIRTVKGRERERATAAERAVVTPQRQKLLGKSMPGGLTTGVVWAHHVHSMRSRCAYAPTATTLPSHSWTTKLRKEG